MSKRTLPAWMYQMPDTRNDRIRELEDENAVLLAQLDSWRDEAVRLGAARFDTPPTKKRKGRKK